MRWSRKGSCARARSFARKVIDTHMPLRSIRDLNDKIEAARGKSEIFDKIRKENGRKFRGFEAWKSAMRAVQAAVDLPFDEGMKLERQAFLDLVPSEQSRAQRYVFFAERKVWKIADVPDDTPTLPIKKVGVIGAGTMGGGISMNFLNAAIPVTIVETGSRRSIATRHHPPQLREHGEEGPADAGRCRNAHGAARPQP